MLPKSNYFRVVPFAVASLMVVLTLGCSSKKQEYVTLGTAPVGGAFAPVGNAISSVINEHKGENSWRVQSQGTKGSQQNIRWLDTGKIQLGMSNSAISYHAARGIGNVG